jgi:ubiquitin-activating enzyme E1
VSCPRLAELNAYVPVNVLPGTLTPEKLAPFKVVVFSHIPLATLLDMNDYTHKHDIAFISTSTHGLFGSLFCDFGPSFMVVDQNGENPITGMISSITPDGLVTMMEEGRHGLEDGDVVTFEEVDGLDVNKREFKVEVKTHDTFSIGPVEQLGTYKQGGIFTQVKVPKEYKFVSHHIVGRLLI